MTQMKLYSWNVNGIRAAEKKGFLDWLAQCGGDVVAVQETKASPDQLSAALLNPIGYHADWSSAEKKGYSGIATYSKAQPVAIKTGFDDTRFDKDGRILISDFERFVFFNIYFPNGGRGPEWVKHKLEFYTRFLEVVAGYTTAGPISHHHRRRQHRLRRDRSGAAQREREEIGLHAGRARGHERLLRRRTDRHLSHAASRRSEILVVGSGHARARAQRGLAHRLLLRDARSAKITSSPPTSTPKSWAPITARSA